MCGIAGIWDPKEKNINKLIENVRAMTDILAHRGPDGEGLYIDEGQGIVLGHRRLAILDLTPTGHQPMESFCGNYIITYNGEVYNYKELRARLLLEGIKFKGSSDAEVIVAAISQWGIEKSLSSFNGMFALSVWDKRKKILILARDQIGKKPLYYYFNDNKFYFSSEIKAIRLLIPYSDLRIDLDSVFEYLLFGIIPGSHTIYEKIKELEPGCLMVLKKPDEYEIKKYWNPDWKPEVKTSDTEIISHTEELLKHAIKIRFRSDVPVGIFLSGGVDSSLITAIASRELGYSIPTFSVGFDDYAFDERKQAKKVSQIYNTKHREVLLRPDIQKVLPLVVQAYDEPFSDPSAVPSYLISQYAVNHLKVTLNGDGGDELFCGYRRHLAAFYSKFFYRIKPATKILYKMLPSSHKYRSYYSLFNRFVEGVSSNSLEKLVSVWFTDLFQEEELKQLLTEEYVGLFEKRKRISDIYAKEPKNPNLLDNIVRMDFIWSLPYDLLVKMDIAAMANSLETRSPFLDKELVEFALRIPCERKLGIFKTKYILRKLSFKYLPKEICNAPKRGFEIPLDTWLSGPLRKMSEDLILSTSKLISPIFQISKLQRLLRNRQNINNRKWSMTVWSLMMLFAWEEFCHNH